MRISQYIYYQMLLRVAWTYDRPVLTSLSVVFDRLHKTRQQKAQDNLSTYQGHDWEADSRIRFRDFECCYSWFHEECIKWIHASQLSWATANAHVLTQVCCHSVRMSPHHRGWFCAWRIWIITAHWNAHQVEDQGTKTIYRYYLLECQRGKNCSALLCGNMIQCLFFYTSKAQSTRNNEVMLLKDPVWRVKI